MVLPRGLEELTIDRPSSTLQQQQATTLRNSADKIASLHMLSAEARAHEGMSSACIQYGSRLQLSERCASA